MSLAPTRASEPLQTFSANGHRDFTTNINLNEKQSLAAQPAILIEWTIGSSRGWSQEDFAYRANIDHSYMGGVERGERNLSFKKLCAIAQTLGCDVAALTRGLPVRDGTATD